MIKRGISLITALLIILTVLTNTFLSVSAQEIVEESTGAQESLSAVSAEIESETVGIVEEAPTITDVKNEINGVRLTWNGIEPFSRYRIYYQKAACASSVREEKYDDSAWVELAVVEGNSYLHTAAEDAELGIYTVCAVDSNNEDASVYDQNGWENRYYSAPEIKSISIGEDGVHLTWDRSEEYIDERYRVLRRSADEDEFSVIASGVIDGAYTDHSAVPGSEYVYTLCLTDSYDRVLSSFTEGVSTLTAYTVITSFENTAKGAKINWLPFFGADKYRVYYRQNGSWVRLTETVNTCYTDTQATDGSTRIYTVRCLSADGSFVSGYHKDGWSNTFYAPPVINDVRYNSGNYTVAWSANAAAPSFRIYRKDECKNDESVIVHAWNEAKIMLEDRETKLSYKTWIEPLSIYHVDRRNNVLYLRWPNHENLVRYLEETYLEQIEKEVRKNASDLDKVVILTVDDTLQNQYYHKRWHAFTRNLRDLMDEYPTMPVVVFRESDAGESEAYIADPELTECIEGYAYDPDGDKFTEKIIAVYAKKSRNSSNLFFGSDEEMPF